MSIAATRQRCPKAALAVERARPGGTPAAMVSYQSYSAPTVARCACGGGCPRCRGAGTEAPSIVHEVLRAPGQSLDPATRAFMESRFGQDFRHVRVHADAQAAESAQAVNALAYTVGNKVVFGTGGYATGTDEGRQLLAHELAHVVQTGAAAPGSGPLRVSEPGEPAEREAERLAVAAVRDFPDKGSRFESLNGRTEFPPSLPRSGGEGRGEEVPFCGPPLSPALSRLLRRGERVTKRTCSWAGERHPDTPLRVAEAVPSTVFRRVAAANVGCPGGRNQAPADPVAHLTRVEAHAQGLAQASAILVAAQAAASIIGVTGPPSAVRLAYEARFGLPPRARGGFRARLTGTVFPNREDVVNDEMDGLSDRLQAIADQFDRSIHYQCITGTTTFMDCEGHCRGRSATACAGIRAILLCPSFWGLSEDNQATLLIHETAHMRWASVLHAANFRHASCYANFVADIFNLPLTTPACPAPATP